MNVGDYVDVKEHRGGGRWTFEAPNNGPITRGHITAVDKHCFSVTTDGGEHIRDVREHFRIAKV